jgi:hypothetical protein
MGKSVRMALAVWARNFLRSGFALTEEAGVGSLLLLSIGASLIGLHQTTSFDDKIQPGLFLLLQRDENADEIPKFRYARCKDATGMISRPGTSIGDRLG